MISFFLNFFFESNPIEIRIWDRRMNERENYYDSGDGRFVLLSGSGDNQVSESPVWILYKCLLWNIYYIILIIFLACNMKSFVDDLSIRMAIKDSSPKSLKTCKIVEKISFFFA